MPIRISSFVWLEYGNYFDAIFRVMQFKMDSDTNFMISQGMEIFVAMDISWQWIQVSMKRAR